MAPPASTMPPGPAVASAATAHSAALPPPPALPAHAPGSMPAHAPGSMPASPPPPPGALPMAAGGVPPPASQALWSARLVDLLNLVRHEFDVIGNDAVHFKSQRDELEHRIAQQFTEASLMQEHVYELEKRHFDVVNHYEEEIKRLHALLDAHGGAPATPDTHAAPVPPPPSLSSGPLSNGRGAAYERERALPAPEPSWPPAKRTKTGADAPRWKRDEGMRDARPTDTAKRSAAPASSLEPAQADDTANDAAPTASTPSAPRAADDAGAPSATSAPPAAAPPASGPASAPTTASHSNASAPEPAEPLPEIKKEGADWVAVYHPGVKPVLDVDLVHTLQHDSVVCCVRFSPDGKTLATGCNRSAQIYDAETGTKTCVLQEETTDGAGDLYIRSVCFSPDGRFLATGAEDREIRIWDIETRTVKHKLSGHKQEIYSLEYSSDGKVLASGSGDQTVRLWDTETGNVLHVLYTSPGQNFGPGVTTVTLSPDGRLVAAGALDTFVRLWDTQTGKLLCRLKGHRDSIYSVSFMPNGQSLVSGSLDKTIKLWDLSSVIKALDVLDDEIASSSLCTDTFAGHKDYVLSVSCAPQGKWIASGSKDRCVRFWDPSTGQSQFVLQGHKNSVIAIHLSQTNQLLATGSGDFQYVRPFF